MNGQQKPLVSPTNANDKTLVDHSQQVSLEQAAKALYQKKAKNRKAIRGKARAIGGEVFAPVLFTYANGRTTWIRMQKDTIKKCGVRKPPEGTLNKEGYGISYKKTKSAKVSYGYKIAARPKSSKSKGKRKVQMRSWLYFSVPDDATFLDVVYFVKGFGKPAGLVNLGSQSFLISYTRAMSTVAAR
jgi:hypothetical protein